MSNDTKPTATNSTSISKQGKDRATNFNAMEDVMCTLAYFCASEDPICGEKQKGHVFKSKIEALYNQLKESKYEEDKREADRPNYLNANGGVGFVPKPYPPQSGNSLYICYNWTICPSTIKFISILKQNDAPKSGEDHATWQCRLMMLYCEKYNHKFWFMKCYEVAKKQPKFTLLFVADLNSGVPSDSSSSANSDVDDNSSCPNAKNKQAAGEGNNVPTRVGGKTTRPIGAKRARKLKQEDEMAEGRAKKFGRVGAATSNHGTTMGAGSVGKLELRSALAQFLSMAGILMSTWMLQTMLTSASEDLRCKYANECICKKILKMRARKAKKEEEIAVAGSSSSSSSSLPPSTPDNNNRVSSPASTNNNKALSVPAAQSFMSVLADGAATTQEEEEEENDIYGPPIPSS